MENEPSVLEPLKFYCIWLLPSVWDPVLTSKTTVHRKWLPAESLSRKQNAQYFLQEARDRVATVREKHMENDTFFRSGKSPGILWMAREI